MTSLLDVDNLSVQYPAKGFRRKGIEVLHGISLTIGAGETLGLVGESGSGKTTLGRAVLGLVPASGGSISFNGEQIQDLAARERRKLAQDIQVVFQDPYTSLNPAMLVTDILTEPLLAHGRSRQDATAAVGALLDRVGLPKDAGSRYAREFSGGQRQRIAIARALAIGPKLIVCDEAVSALDLVTQARVLDLLIEIQRETQVAYLFISHDLTVVRHISHRVAVMYRGDIVETNTARTVTSNPSNAYTKKLLLAAPVADPEEQVRRRRARIALLAS